jgi:hypothetical protein
MRTHFLHAGNPKKRLGCFRLNDVLSRRMALRNHYLPSEYLKKQFWWCRWSDVSWCHKNIKKHLLNSGHWKNDLDEFEEVMF